MGRPLRLAALLYAVAAGAYALDRATKLWAEHALAGRPPLRLIPGVLHLTYTTNSGGAFGIGRSAPWLFAGATVVVVGIIVAISTRLPRTIVAVALGLVLGGALGNLTDRALGGPGLGGRVTDFIDLRVWPVFNLADSAIVIGAILLAASSLRPERAQRSGAAGPRVPGG
ncbi:Lipoprotein signal peptidase [bacterium HR12]|nr:Lipoprotein signal peptidase [bacterium HR12]